MFKLRDAAKEKNIVHCVLLLHDNTLAYKFRTASASLVDCRLENTHDIVQI